MEELFLRPMTQPEFIVFEAKSKLEYAAEKEKGEGHSKERAAQIAEESFQRYLPKGLDSPNQFLFQVLEKHSQRFLGSLWYGIQGEDERKTIFVCDIVFAPEERGKGWGKKTMLWLEGEAKRMGIKRLSLHVFGHNKIARGLYESLGYQPTNIMMLKLVP